MMKMVLQEMIRLNNEGVALLKEQKLQEAVERFTAAGDLACDPMVADHMENTPSQQQQQQQQQQSQSQPTSHWDLIQGVTLFECYSWEHHRSEPSSWDDPHAFVLYERAFCFADDFDPVTHDILFHAVLVYNLAFAYHRMALTQVKDYTRNMMSALRCYKFGLDTVRDFNNNNTRDLPAGESLFVVALAFLNNMGHASAHFGRADVAASCRTTLDDLMESYVPECISPDDQDFFYFGHFFQRMGGDSTAAAAA